MLHPSYTDLINAVNSEVEPGEQPVVQEMSRSLREQQAKSRFPSQFKSFTRVR